MKDQNDARKNGGKLKWHMRINWFYVKYDNYKIQGYWRKNGLWRTSFSLFCAKKKMIKNRNKQEKCGKIGKCNWKTNKKDSHKVHQLYTHTHVRSRKEKPRLKWSNYQTFSRRVLSSFCFSPCPFLCRLLACKDMANLINCSNQAFLFFFIEFTTTGR